MGIFTDDQTNGVAQDPAITRGGGSGGIYPGQNISNGTSGSGSAGGGGQRALIIQDEGTVITADASSINFTGSGVSATAAGNAVTVVIDETVYTGGQGININDKVISIAVGGVLTANLADGSVTTIKLADQAVTTAKIADQAVNAAQIANGAVGNIQIASNSITTIKIVDGAIATAKLADGSVTHIKLATDSVDSDNIVSGGVSNRNMASDSVGTDNIIDDAVTNDKVADNAINTAQLANTSVTTAKIAANAVGTTELADDAVDSDKIASNGVSNDNLIHDSIVINGITAVLGGNIRIPTGAGPTPPSDQSQLGVTLSPTSIEFATTGTTNCSATATINTGYTIKANSTSVSVTDAQNNAVTVTRASDTVFNFTLPNNEIGEAHITLEGTVVDSSDDSEYVHTASGVIHINRGWYSALTTTQPSDISSMDNRGVWRSSGSFEFTTTGVAAARAYFALPTRSGGYEFKSGELFLTSTDLGVLNTNFTLYRIDDFDNSGTGQTLTISITEA